jgi:hypothetical protein
LAVLASSWHSNIKYPDRLLEAHRPEELSRYFIDVEYDKNGDDPKRIKNLPRAIRPDILVHMRDVDVSDNLVAFECKKLRLIEDDRTKLLGLLENGFNYQLCFGISYLPNTSHFFLYEREDNFIAPREINKQVIAGSLARKAF